ncbi:MAG: hypothetical protein AB8B52_01745 [Winogradskyella sp.]
MSVFLKKISLLLLSGFLICNGLAYASLCSLKQSSFYKPSFLVNGVLERNFDYVVIGASTGLTTLNTQLIDTINGRKGINLSMDDTSLSSQYLMLQHFLAEGKTTSICVVASSITSYKEQNESISANDYRFLPFTDRSYVLGYFQSFSSGEANILAKSKYFPITAVSYYNAEVFYPALLSLVYPNKRNRFDENGNYTYPVQNRRFGDIISRKLISLKFENLALKKIKDLCDKEGITLICYISPMKEDIVEVSNSDYNVINHSDKLENIEYFFDNVHVNSLGREVISSYFAEELSPYFSN